MKGKQSLLEETKDGEFFVWKIGKFSNLPTEAFRKRLHEDFGSDIVIKLGYGIPEGKYDEERSKIYGNNIAKTFYCHKIILCCLGNVFQRLIYGRTFEEFGQASKEGDANYKEQIENVVNLPYIPARLFEFVLDLVYTGTFEIRSKDINENFVVLFDLMSLGLEYQLSLLLKNVFPSICHVTKGIPSKLLCEFLDLLVRDDLFIESSFLPFVLKDVENLRQRILKKCGFEWKDYYLKEPLRISLRSLAYALDKYDISFDTYSLGFNEYFDRNYGLYVVWMWCKSNFLPFCFSNKEVILPILRSFLLNQEVEPKQKDYTSVCTGLVEKLESGLSDTEKCSSEEVVFVTCLLHPTGLFDWFFKDLSKVFTNAFRPKRNEIAHCHGSHNDIQLRNCGECKYYCRSAIFFPHRFLNLVLPKDLVEEFNMYSSCNQCCLTARDNEIVHIHIGSKPFSRMYSDAYGSDYVTSKINKSYSYTFDYCYKQYEAFPSHGAYETILGKTAMKGWYSGTRPGSKVSTGICNKTFGRKNETINFYYVGELLGDNNPPENQNLMLSLVETHKEYYNSEYEGIFYCLSLNLQRAIEKNYDVRDYGIKVISPFNFKVSPSASKNNVIEVLGNNGSISRDQTLCIYVKHYSHDKKGIFFIRLPKLYGMDNSESQNTNEVHFRKVYNIIENACIGKEPFEVSTLEDFPFTFAYSSNACVLYSYANYTITFDVDEPSF